MPILASPQTRIDDYIRELSNGLHMLPAEQITDIVQEIRSYILDTTGSMGTMTDSTVIAALNRLGPPSELAASYVADNMLATAQKNRMPWTVLRGVFHWATVSVQGGLVLIVCCVGYLFGAAFFIAALAKPFNPKAGLWLTNPDTYSLVLGMTGAVPQGHELLGWKLIPLGMALGGGTIMGTTYLAQSFVRRFRKARQPRGAAD